MPRKGRGKPEEAWYGVTRRYEVEETCYVQASSKSEAIAKCREADYEYIGQDMTAIGGETWKNPRRKSDDFHPRSLL